jgi:integrase
VVAGPPPDLEEQGRALCELLNAYGVDYLLLGSMAGRLQGADLLSLDVDVAPRRSDLERLANALNVLRPRWRSDDFPDGFKIDGRLEGEGLTFHHLRHSAVGFLMDANASLAVMQQRMGHASIRVARRP